jgi:hypothetical protein
MSRYCESALTDVRLTEFFNGLLPSQSPCPNPRSSYQLGATASWPFDILASKDTSFASAFLGGFKWVNTWFNLSWNDWVNSRSASSII